MMPLLASTFYIRFRVKLGLLNGTLIQFNLGWLLRLLLGDLFFFLIEV